MKSGYDQFFKQAKTVAQKCGNRTGRSTITQGKPKPKKKGIGWRLATLSFLSLVGGAVVLSNQDFLDTFVKRIEVGVFGAARAESPATAAKIEPAKPVAESATAPPQPEKKDGDSVDHLKRLVDREKQLDTRETELKQSETELQTEKDALEKRLKELQDTRREISSVLEDKVKSDEQKVDTLVQVYSNMKPQQAAKIFETMDESLAIDILGRMKKKNAAEIMNLLKSDKAQSLTEKYAGYKKR